MKARKASPFYSLIAVVAVLLLPVTASAAEFAHSLSVARIRMFADGMVWLGTTTQPPYTCSCYGEYFVFDSTTAAGKNFLSIVLSHKLAGKQIQVWYERATGADGATCNDQTGARLIGIAAQ